jgi:hypothetical protein
MLVTDHDRALRALSDGNVTSEGRKAWRAELVGSSLLLLGTAHALAGGWGARWPLVAAGGLLVLAGAHLIAHTTSSYTRGRAEIKAATATPLPSAKVLAARGL